MAGCEANERNGTQNAPRIAILMAVYEPRMDWLQEQLISLNAQTYPNLMLYVRDDCSPNTPFEQIEACVAERIRAFPCEIRRNEKNLGSNATFELLTREAEGAYFAYCDQDDVWLPEKLTVLKEAIERENAQMVCSDMFIIDGDGKQTADSMTKIRRHHRFQSGEGLAKALLVTNFATGCTTLIRAETAKEAVPFCPYMVHDQYLALCAASKGKLLSLPQQLVRYRIHANNQTPLMAGVTDKKSYVEIRIRRLILRLEWLERAFAADADLLEVIREQLEWARAREANFAGDRSARGIVWRYRRFSLMPSLFELAAPRLPEGMFQAALWAARHNYI